MYKKILARKILNHRNTIVVLAVIVLLFGVLGVKILQSSEAAISPRPQVGVQFHCTWGSAHYSNAERVTVLNKLSEAGVEWVRMDVGWAALQPTSGTTFDMYHVNLLQFCVDEAQKRGIKVLAMVHLTPGWANANQGMNAPPHDLATYANFMEWVAGNINGVAAWQIWNEPDPSQSFWTGTTRQYADMLKLAYPKIKSADPAAKVVLGGPSYNDDIWVDAVYSHGTKDYFDVMATQPYQGKQDEPPEHPDTDNKKWWFTHFPAVLAVMNKYGDGSKEVWFTEYGWSSHGNEASTPLWQLGVTEDQQADYMIRAIKYAQENYPNVKAMFWYNERNKNHQDIHQANFGLLRRDLTEKPVYNTLKQYLAESDAPLAGDANVDGRVNAIDLSIVIARDGQDYPQADFNRDGTIGAADLSVVLSRWTW